MEARAESSDMAARHSRRSDMNIQTSSQQNSMNMETLFNNFSSDQNQDFEELGLDDVPDWLGPDPQNHHPPSNL